MSEKSLEQEVLGAGLAFPLRIQEGEAKLAIGKDHLTSCVFHFAMYEREDLIGAPTYGGHVPPLLFKPLTGSSLNFHEEWLRQGLENWEPRIISVRVTAGRANNESTKVVLLTQFEIDSMGEDAFFSLPLEREG